MPIYGYMLPNLSLMPNLYEVQLVYNNNVAWSLHEALRYHIIVIHNNYSLHSSSL